MVETKTEKEDSSSSQSKNCQEQPEDGESSNIPREEQVVEEGTQALLHLLEKHQDHHDFEDEA